MRVLHVWSVAGVAEIIAKYMDRLTGTESKVLVRRKFDKFGYNAQSRADGPYVFTARAILEARKHDIVQVHNWDRVVPLLGRFSSAPRVLTYHNFNIANEWTARERYWSRTDARVIATPGLSEKVRGAIFIADPVDTEAFYDKREHQKGTALHTEYGATGEAEALAKDRGLEFTVLRRDKEPVPHSEMPAILNRFEYYIDVKRSPSISPDVIPATSKTCLEALACGCKVIRWDGRVLEGVPDENRPENVARRYFDLYSGLLENRIRGMKGTSVSLGA